MNSNVPKNSSGQKLFHGERKISSYRGDPAFPVWSRIHSVVSNRPRFKGLDYSGLSRISRTEIEVQSEEKTMKQAIIIAIIILAATVYFIQEDTPQYCNDFNLLGRTYDTCLTKSLR